jgi:hypothetical protein
MIGAHEYRRMESSSASAPPARELETIKAAGRVTKQETKASDPLVVPELRRERETNAPSPREMSISKGAWETNMLERERLPLSGETEGL